MNPISYQPPTDAATEARILDHMRQLKAERAQRQNELITAQAAMLDEIAQLAASVLYADEASYRGALAMIHRIAKGGTK